MNIEESKSLLGWVSLNKLYIDTHNECDYHNIHTAIETLLTAYEKEKEKNKKINKYIEDRAKIGKDIQTFINKDYVEQEYISKEKAEQKERKAYIKGTNDADELCNKMWKDKIKAMLENEIINISGFECVAKEDVQSLLEKE